MKKHILLVSAFVAIIFYSCTEKEVLSTGGSGVAVSDTTYVTTPQSQTPRRVFVEEYTGVQCTNCPAGAELIKQAELDHPGLVVAVGLHSGSLSSPIRNVSKDTFQTVFAQNLLNSYFDEDANKPSAAIDRIKENGAYFYAATKWLSVINERLATPSPLNLSVTSSFNASTEEFTIAVEGNYTADVSQKQSLTIEITEDGIQDAQDGADGSVILDYIHNHVLRDMLTEYTGQPLLSDLPSIEKGRVFVKVFKYKIPDAKKAKWNVDNMNIIAVVHNSDNKEVQQAAETKLKPED